MLQYDYDISGLCRASYTPGLRCGAIRWVLLVMGSVGEKPILRVGKMVSLQGKERRQERGGVLVAFPTR